MLAEQIRYAVVWIRQTYERQFMLFPVIIKNCLALRAHNQYLRITFNELLIVSTQLRHMPAAEWSKESPVKHQKNILLVLIF